LILVSFIAAATAGHALLYKRDPRAALGWMAVCFLFPVAGPFLYFLFGINRVRTRAKKLISRSRFRIEVGYERAEQEDRLMQPGIQVSPQLEDIARISDAVSRRPRVGGNRVELLRNGEEAFPAMVEAIETSQRSVVFSSYIFETNTTGLRFIDALARAENRGVEVRVLIDGIGELYSFPRAGSVLARRGVRVARFLPPRLIPPSLHINLRNHRKILVADGRVGFVGGMNIGDRHLAANHDNPSRVVDAHFRLTGPVVTQIESAFLEDWSFCTQEEVDPPRPCGAATGNAVCRAIADGPNEYQGKLATIVVGAACSARKCLRIMTPYFLPSRELIAALQTAALRGVDVSVILPSKNNLPFVHWATRNMLWEILQHDVHVYYQPPPFAHTKLLVVDDHYALIGSANMDPRSFRLNFELAVEVYDEGLAGVLASYMEEVQSRSTQVFLSDMDSRALHVRSRDALAWLFSPYL